MRPDMNDLVVPGCKKKLAIGCEAEDVAGAISTTSFDDDFRFVSGAAIELLGERFRGEEPKNDQTHSNPDEHENPRLERRQSLPTGIYETLGEIGHARVRLKAGQREVHSENLSREASVSSIVLENDFVHDGNRIPCGMIPIVTPPPRPQGCQATSSSHSQSGFAILAERHRGSGLGRIRYRQAQCQL